MSTGRSALQLTLRAKLVLLVSALLTAVAVFLFLFFPSRMESLSRYWLDLRVENMLRVVGRAVMPGIEFADKEGITEVLTALAADSDVKYALVLAGDGSDLGSLNAHIAPRLEMPRGNEPVILERDDMVHGVLALADKVGTQTAAVMPGKRAMLAIGYSLATLQAETRRNFIVVTTAAATVFLVGLVISYLVGTSLARQIADASSRVGLAASEIYAATQEQEAAGTQQSTSVQEISQTMQSLSESARHIAGSAEEVLANAERARETTDTTASKIAELSGHANRIAEILEAIRDIADRSDLLALNASLEATRAGEAGRSFTLVAAEMRRLAERVTGSVEDVKSLVADVRASGASSVVATEESKKLVESTTESARQISMVTQQQRTATEQVSQTMRDIARGISQTVSATQQTRTSAEALKGEADKLAVMVGRSQAVQRPV
jgi:hypothetical protein